MEYKEYKKVKLPLVERQTICDVIEKAIDSVRFADDKKKRIINIFGNGGHGKTFLEEHLEKKYREEYKDALIVSYDFQSSPDVGIDDILYSWASMINRQNTEFQFELFASVYDKYQRMIHSNNKSKFKIGIYKENVVPVFGNLTKKVFIESVKEKIPGIEEVVDILEPVIEPVKEKVLQPFSHYSDFNKNVDSCKNENEMRQWLTRAFVEDLKSILLTKPYPLIFLLDTYEIYTHDVARMNRYTEEWLKTLISLLDNVVWVISGRGELKWKVDCEIKALEVKAISEGESFSEIFNDPEISIKEEEHQQCIKNVSNGIPLLISNCVNEYLAMQKDGTLDLNKITGKTEDFVKRLERDLTDSEKDLLHILALFETWPDRKVIEMILNENLYGVLLSTRFDSLLQMNLIKQRGMEKELARCLRKELPTTLKKHFFIQLVNSTNWKEYQAYISDRTFRLFCELSKEDCEEITSYKQDLLKQLQNALLNNPVAFEKIFGMLKERERELSIDMKCSLLKLRRLYENFNNVNLYPTQGSENKYIEENEKEYFNILITQKDYHGLYIFGEAYINVHQDRWVADVIEFLCGEKDSQEAQFYGASLKMMHYNEKDQCADSLKVYEDYNKILSDSSNVDAYCYYRARYEYWLCINRIEQVEALDELLGIYKELSEKDPYNPIMKKVVLQLCQYRTININERLDVARQEYEKHYRLVGTRNSYLLADLIKLLANLLKENGEYEQAVNYYEMAMPYYQEGTDVAHMHFMNIKLSLVECYRKNNEKQKAHDILDNIRKTYSEIFELDTIFGLIFISDFIREYYDFLKGEEFESVHEEIEYCHTTLNEAKNAGEDYIRGKIDNLARRKLIDIYDLLVRIKGDLGYEETAISIRNANRRIYELKNEIILVTQHCN